MTNMCMMSPPPPQPLPPPPAPAPPPPPPTNATAETVSQAGAAPTAAAKQTRRNPLRTDSGATDSVATGLNIPA